MYAARDFLFRMELPPNERRNYGRRKQMRYNSASIGDNAAMGTKCTKPKRQGPIEVLLPFEEAVSDLLKVKPERKSRKKSGRP
jgi:hypothetical protein